MCKGAFWLAIVVMSGPIVGMVDTSLQRIHNPLTHSTHKKSPKNIFTHVGFLFRETIATVALLHAHLLSWDTFRVGVAVAPFFIASRMADHPLHTCFYQKKAHKNKKQLPRFFFHLSNYGIHIPMVMLSSYALWGKTEETRTIGRTFLTALPFVMLGKNIIKVFSKFDCSKRPWNEHFSKKYQRFGGFPSGHMAQSVYMASFFGMCYGPSHAIPLGLVAAFVGATFINGNRHYLSQIVAGGAWGAIFAISSYKIMKKYNHDTHTLKLDMGTNDYGNPAINITYNF